MSGEFREAGSMGNELVSVMMPGRDLAEFIAEMLGQRRTLSRDFQTTFRINQDWLTGLVEIIDQRVSAQNQGKLVGFTAQFFYLGGKKISLYKKGDFSSFNDVSQDISTGFRINFTYLIQFPYKKNPERQDILVEAQTIPQGITSTNTPKSVRAIIIPINADFGSLKMEIQHSDITWGEDIYNLISNHVLSRFPPRKVWIDRLRLYFLPFSPPLVLICVMFGVTYNEAKSGIGARAYLQEQMERFSQVSGNIRDLEEKINSLINYYILINASKNLSILLTLFIAPACSLFALYFLLRLRSQPYVILNSATELYVVKKDKLRSVVKSVLLAGFILSALAGAFGNAIYSRLPNF